MKKRIYFEASALLNIKMSGIGYVTLNMIRELVKNPYIQKNYEIMLIIPKTKGDVIKQWQITGVKPIYLPIPPRLWNLLARFKIAPPIDTWLGRGIYIFTNYRRWPLAKSPSITYIHDISFELFPQFTEPGNLIMLRNNIKRWTDQSTLIITDSKSSRQEITDFYNLSPKKVKAIYCGINEEYKPTSQERVGDVCWKYSLKRPYLLYLGNLEPRKNLQKLLDSLDYLPTEFKKYSLVLVGGMSWLSEGIVDAIKKKQQEGWSIIKPSEYVPDFLIPPLITGADAFVFPTLHEGFGIPAIEAMACGTPVVTSNIPVMREVAGEAALFADPNDVKDIAEKITKVITDTKLRSKLVEAGKKQAAKYTWTKSADQLVEYIKEIEK